MTILRYQTQAQQQQQEGPDGAPAEVPTGDPTTDDIVSDILGGKEGGKRPRDARPAPADDDEPPSTERVQEEEEPEDPIPDDDDEEELPPAAEDDDDQEDDEDDGEEPAAGDLAAARAARKRGDLDEACRLAFGCKPEQLAPKAYDWTKWRQANERKEQQHAKERQALEQDYQLARNEIHGERVKLHQTIEALRPYEKYRVAEQAWERDGDPAHLVEIIQGITKMSFDEANKIIVTKTRRSPADRAMAARIAELEARIEAANREREQQQSQLSEQQQRAADIQHITSQLQGPIAKVPKAAERIYRILDKTRGPLGLTKTVEQAAAIVLKKERDRVLKSPFIKRKPKPGTPPAVSNAARTLRQRAQGGALLRRNSQNNGASTAKDESTDDIVSDILRHKPARRAS